MLDIINKVSSFVWGPPTLILIVGTGLYLTFRLGFLQIRTLPYALKLAYSPKHKIENLKAILAIIKHYQHQWRPQSEPVISSG